MIQTISNKEKYSIMLFKEKKPDGIKRNREAFRKNTKINPKMYGIKNKEGV